MKIITLSTHQREKLRNIRLYACSTQEKKGKPIINGMPFKMLDFQEIFESVKATIISEGFSTVERVSPKQSNCIIRAYKTKHYKYDDVLTYNIYGGYCYVRNGLFFTTIDTQGDTYSIDYTRCRTRRWLCQDEYIDFNHEFVDFYVRVS